jgi:hypothetical protein
VGHCTAGVRKLKEEEVTDKLCHFRIMPHENEQNTLLQLEVIKFVSALYSSSWEQVPLYNGFRIEGVFIRV